MPKATTTFSITVGSLPAWYPAWQAPGVIKAIPSSSLLSAIDANGWKNGKDIVAGGTGWPRGLYAYSGGTVAYVEGRPYLCISGGGHGIGPDNSIYAFGPLTDDTPSWMRLGKQSADEDVVTCSARYRDGRPSARHTVGDFSYGNGRIVMLWENSPYCSDGGTSPGIDVFDIDAREWDSAKSDPIIHPSHNTSSSTHSMSCYHPYTGLFYAKGKGARSDSFGSYDPAKRVFTSIGFSGWGNSYDCAMCTMGPREYVYFFKDSGQPAGRINTATGRGEEWGANLPGGARSAVGYDSLQDRLYMPLTGVTANSENMPQGSRGVAWLDAGATSNPTWVQESFHGDTPDQQIQTGVFGRWSYVPELRGFVLNNAVDSMVYFYRTAE